MHLAWRDQITGIHDQCLDCNTCDPRGCVQRANKSSDSPEEGVHGHSQDPKEEQRDEELRGGPLEVRHEVDNDVKYKDLDED